MRTGTRSESTDWRRQLRRVSARLLALAGLALAGPGVTFAAEPELVRLCFNTWTPYAYSEDGVPKGLSIRVIDEAARRAGLAVEYNELPWKRCLHAVRTGAMDAVLDAAARSEFLQGPSSFSVYTNTFWVRKDATTEAFSLDALRGKTVGLVTGYTYPDELVKNPPYAVDFSMDDDTNMRKLAAGRVDAIVADRVSTMHTAGRAGLAVRPLLPSHSYDPLFVSFNKSRRAMHERLNAAISQMREDGFISEVYREILGVDYDELIEPR